MITRINAITESIVTLWWRRLPLMVSRFSKVLSTILSEGIYLVAWPHFAAFAPPFVFLLGLLAGATRFGGEQVFTQSAIVLLLAILFGFVSGQLGTMFVISYSVVDFITYESSNFFYGNFIVHIQMRIALIITYVALAMLSIGIPLIIRLIRSQTPMPSPESGNIRVLADIMLGGIASSVLVFIYLQALPMLIRPLFIWRGDVPPVEAVTPLQGQAWLFAVVALIIAVVRIIAEYSAMSIEPTRVEQLATDIEQAQQGSTFLNIPYNLKPFVQATMGTLLLAGLLDVWTSTISVFLGLTLINVARTVVASKVTFWPTIMERFPVVIRLIIGFILAFLICSWILTDRLSGTSFQPLVWALLVSIFCIALLFPEPSR